MKTRYIWPQKDFFMRYTYVWLLAWWLVGLTSWAGGFQVSLQGQKQNGMANLGAATHLDAAAVFFNPGALSHVQGININVGGGTFGDVQYQQASTGLVSSNERAVGTPFGIYASTPLGKDNWLSRLTFGMGVYTPYGSHIIYPDDWVRRFVTRRGEFKHHLLSTHLVKPSAHQTGGHWRGFGVWHRRFFHPPRRPLSHRHHRRR